MCGCTCLSVSVCVPERKARQHYRRGSSGQTEAGTSETHTITLTGATPPHSPSLPLWSRSVTPLSLSSTSTSINTHVSVLYFIPWSVCLAASCFDPIYSLHNTSETCVPLKQLSVVRSGQKKAENRLGCYGTRSEDMLICKMTGNHLSCSQFPFMKQELLNYLRALTAAI